MSENTPTVTIHTPGGSDKESWVVSGGAAVALAFLALRAYVRDRTTEVVCRAPGVDYWDCWDDNHSSGYDAIHTIATGAGIGSGTFIFVVGVLSLPLSTLAGVRRWGPSSITTFVLLAVLALALPTPGPEYLDPIRRLLIGAVALSAVAYTVIATVSRRSETSRVAVGDRVEAAQLPDEHTNHDRKVTS
ncbi:hypothetical protein ACT17_23025 [Mycolicibacterium conceptionense]|uniref:Uncharacterized protein n=1 Tax=Mycolicibacterium conceptionense TaxID=451644 RepID=A0A0J8U695_9MYCO|nr:hypothetical protein [Mycolicibacterium conceptionense]KMV15965.1 hypothetical protein ACT17_23025 [Mycolicibacterium conceptionense]